ncbi:TDT family transporter [Rhodococcoides kyotonense]|uniref:Tellurite resistance protein TehA n=1 Tax=Rhodococcoides kyotonense TaxID=398843 RepID=A0A239N685_9NOCA|nr:TDT family transporter [Rhodococcus kyotonensis]SNT49689.1 Tellurite resistance protein TehA [Rhodococcus kyotonensis]
MTAAVLTTPPAFLFRELDRPGRILENLTPNWFATIMGTGIVANAAATLPIQLPMLRVFATGVWVFASIALVVLTIAFAAHWILYTENARSHAAHPVTGLFYGAIPMALLTVGTGTLLLGTDILGATPALCIAGMLWVVGTAVGLATALWFPCRRTEAEACPAWLMPVVPPMVSATAGAIIAQHMPDSSIRTTLVATSCVMFALSLVLGSTTLAIILNGLAKGRTPPLQAIPTVWITLGLVGQSVTAAHLLAVDTGSVWLQDASIVYGLVVGAFGVVMVTLATTLTIRAARRGLRFTMTWWSFTFPVGTCVTGATALGATFGAANIVAVCLYAFLVSAWAVVAVNTARGTISGRIFLAA